MKRIVFGVVGGLGVGVVLIGLIESYAHKLSSTTDNALLLVLVAYIIGSFFGGAVATLIDKSGKYLPALIVSGLLLLAGLANFAMLPHPVWFMVISSLCYPVFAILGAWIVRKFQI
jgi:hypothetical protein